DGDAGRFRRSDGVVGRRATFGSAARPAARGLERLLTQGDDELERRICDARARRTPLRLPDATLLDLLRRLVAAGSEAGSVADAMRDVLAERALRFDHPVALRAAVAELERGGDPLAAYVAARA